MLYNIKYSLLLLYYLGVRILDLYSVIVKYLNQSKINYFDLNFKTLLFSFINIISKC